MQTFSMPIITLDGPSGVGKSSVSKMLATHLGWHFLDSGAMYRIVAFQATQQNINLTDVPALQKIAENLDVTFQPNPQEDEPADILVYGHNITHQVRDEQTGMNASQVAIFQEVRTALLAKQRQFAKSPGLIADGRDMGTVVFPNAPLKCFLTASTEERAKRRAKQLQAKQIHVSIAEIINDLEERDARDKHRNIAPLKPADDALIIDTSELSIAEVLETVLGAWQQATD